MCPAASSWTIERVRTHLGPNDTILVTHSSRSGGSTGDLRARRFKILSGPAPNFSPITNETIIHASETVDLGDFPIDVTHSLTGAMVVWTDTRTGSQNILGRPLGYNACHN